VKTSPPKRDLPAALSSSGIRSRTVSGDGDVVIVEPSTTDETLEALRKAPVADRVNAKLAAKQFDALVNKIMLESSPTNSRGVSPQRERSTSIALPADSTAKMELSPLITMFDEEAIR
jgi:hypothetical protein